MFQNQYNADIQQKIKSNQQKQIRNMDSIGSTYQGGSCCCKCHGGGSSGGGYSGGSSGSSNANIDLSRSIGGSAFSDTGLNRPLGSGLSSGVREYIKEMKSDINQVGGSKPSNFIKRTEIVKDVMKKRGVSLMEASSIVKKENLYTK